jgi:hypothetical protein
MSLLRPRAARRIALATLTTTTLIGSMLVGAPLVAAGSTIFVTTTDQEINGDADCSLQEAIYSANLDDARAPDPGSLSSTPAFITGCVPGSGADIIELPPMSVFTFADPISDYDNYVGPSVTPIITSEIIIEGRGARLQRNQLGRLTRAFVVGAGGDLDLREVHVKGFAIRGGNGADGGGGGMGAGGAIYVTEGSLRVQWSTFEGNVARGGDGSFQDDLGGGGGGGLFGDGGTADRGGGGGGGSRGSGAHSGGGGGRVTSGDDFTGEPGLPCGGAGAVDDSIPGADNGDDGFCSGGGGGGGGIDVPLFDPFCSGAGGDGHYGGGGGGGALDGDGGTGGFGGGGGGGGGDGGFGGGGGSSGFACLSSGRGQGGTFGGDGGEPVNNGGGGGAGLGGAIFGDLAHIAISNSTFAFNSAVRGLSGGGDSRDGRGAGGAAFLVGGSLSIDSSTFAGNEAITVTGGGGGAIVVYDPEGSDEASLRLRNSIVAGNGASECYTRNGVTTTGSSNNVITDGTMNNLGDPACPGVLSSDDPGLGPLTLNAPGRTPTMAIGLTSIAIDAAATTTSPLDDQRGVARPQGGGPDIGAYEANGSEPGIPPVTTITLEPAAPNGSNGWYQTAVGFSITASDTDDVVAETRCAVIPASTPTAFDDLVDPCPLVAPSDGHYTVYAASRDVGGNTEWPPVVASLKIDGTAPALAPTLNVTTVTLGKTGVVASPDATDPTSGVASQGCGAVDTSTPGARSVSCTATDNAGNVAVASLGYVVEYRLLGFFSPVPKSKWKAGGIVPIMVALGNHAGTRISDASASALARACRVTFTGSGAQTKSPQCMWYDPITNQFYYLWKLSKHPVGTAGVTLAVSYPGSALTTRLSKDIVIVR